MVASGNHFALEELRRLGQQLDAGIDTLTGLQPLFSRVEQLAREHAGDFEVELLAHELKQRILTRGAAINRQTPVPPPLTVPTPPPIAERAPPIAEPSPPVVRPTAPQEEPRRSAARLWVAIAALALIGGAVLWNKSQQAQRKTAEVAPMDASIITLPTGAAVGIDGQPTCKSDCVAKLAPGTYEVTATLDGYEPARQQVVIKPGQKAEVKLTLAPLAATIRILADLPAGKVSMDGQAAGELQDGQWILENVQAGAHSLHLQAGLNEVNFTVNIAPSAIPVVEGATTTKNLFAGLVASRGDRARLITSTGPLKLALNGAAQIDATVAGTDLAGYVPGPVELRLGDGATERTLVANFTAAPAVTVFLQTDQDIGTLLISTGQDDVRIFLNGKEQRKRTQKGMARIQTFGKVDVRVQKPGFEDVAVQTVNVTRGSETKLAFTLKALPRFAGLSITGGTPNAEIWISQRIIGNIGADGTFRTATLAPGDHPIELRREQFEPKRLTRTFRAGENVVLGPADSSLTAVRVVAPPPPPPPPAPPKTEPAPVKPTAPKPRTGDMLSFDMPGAWREEEGVWKHRGAAALTYALPPNGIFTFSIYMLRGGGLLRPGRVRWMMNYVDAQNYTLYELDPENFWAKVVEGGKTLERKKVAHKQDKSMRVWNIQIDASATRLVHKIQGDAGWVELDTWQEPGRDFTKGKFGILVSGNDEVGLSNFRFTPR
jgi:hypothetical protein